MAGMAGRPDLEKSTLSVALVFGFESADWIVAGIPAIASRITFGVSPSIFFADRRRLQMFPTKVIGSKDLLDLPANHLAGPSDDLRPHGPNSSVSCSIAFILATDSAIDKSPLMGLACSFKNGTPLAQLAKDNCE